MRFVNNLVGIPNIILRRYIMSYLNIQSMRIPYRKEGDRFYDLNVEAKHPFQLFKQWFEEAANCPDLYEANAMCLSTASKDGIPSSRVVLLKGLDTRGFHFFTNSLSRKGQEIAENPNVSLLFYWEPLKRQVRIEGVASFLPDSEATEYFSSRPKSSQVAAYVSNQSEPIPSDMSLLDEFNKATKEFESVSSVPKPKSWAGYAVMPHSMEFWQGQTSRLHDRINFFRPKTNQQLSEFAKVGEDGWYYERLAP